MAKRIHSKEAPLDIIVPIDKARETICFPDPASEHCTRLMEELQMNGINYLISSGDVWLGSYRVLGRGWASIVFLALMDEKIVAVKALRPRSRRRSLLHEAAFLLTASTLRISPEPYKYSDLFIAMQYIDSLPLINSAGSMSPAELYYTVRRLVHKAYLLDSLGISHNELARPHNQVLVERGTYEPYIIDYESATVTQSPTNLTQLVGGLARIREIKTKLHLDIDYMRPLLQRYKQAETLTERAKIVNEILETIRPR